MPKATGSRVLRYGVAVLSVAIALALKLLLKPWIDIEEIPFVMFFVSVTIGAWYGGIGSGVLATALSAWVCDYFFISPGNVLSGNSLGQNLQLSLFVLEALFISALVTALQSAKRRAELSQVEAQHHQELLRQREEGFRLLIEGVKDYAIYRLDANGCIVSWNQGAQGIKGYRAEEILGKNFSCFYLPEDIQRGKPSQNLKLAAESGRFEEEGWRIRSDGSQFWANVALAALRDEAGNLQGFAKVTRDITHSKQAEEERNQLLAREQATRAVAEAANAQLQRLQTITDAALAPLSLEDLLRELLNRISEILQADTAAILMIDAQNNNLVVRAAKGLEAEVSDAASIPIGEGFAGRVAALRQPIIVEQDAYTQVYSPILRERGIQSLIGAPLLVENRLLGVIHLGTLRARQFTNDDVQVLQLGASRTALAIEHARLYEAERDALAQAKLANRIKDEFLALVSHELRTPLQSILGWAQMLSRRKLNEATVSKALETMERNAKQQVKLIEDILDVSRIVRGEISLHIIPLNPVPIIESAIKASTPAASTKAIQIESVLDRSAGSIFADPDRLQQIAGNLLENAVKFTHQGGCVKICFESNGDYAHLVVSDTGEGIGAEFLPHVFEDFRQGERSLTRVHGGLGLGLTIVRYLVEMHGGTVGAASEGQGKGATFTVKLPLPKAASSEIGSSPVTLQLNSKKTPSRYI